MKVFETKIIKEIDALTIKKEGISSVDLMERAADGCVAWIEKNLSFIRHFIIFTGPGNNGGDGWAIARLLADKGFMVGVYHLPITDKRSADSEINHLRVIQQAKVEIKYVQTIADFPILEKNTVVIDALFGSGLSRPLNGLDADVVKRINDCENQVVSIDIPSGLFGEDNSKNRESAIVEADFTLSFQFPKKAFFFSENEKYTGQWYIIPIGIDPGVIQNMVPDCYFVSTGDIAPMIKKRKAFSHKGTYGHALLMAGSYGMTGAAILAAKACMRGGTGLLTTHVPKLSYPITQVAVPESVFSIDPHDKLITRLPDHIRFSAIGIGPGIGTADETTGVLNKLLQTVRVPLILDADALNILSMNVGMLDLLPEQTIITPHPGEFDRLMGASASGFERNQRQIECSKKYKIIIVLKGAYSSISLPNGSCYYNSTGNPGMATAGSGDVLTGVILSLLSQGYQPWEAAVTGTFLHGLAGDLAAAEIGQQALIADDIISYLGYAYKKIT
jgi:ADP-dependent NAD(P)H-hydrate dehydratase / NAD(P)H-hydrate epimerase